MVDKCEVLPSYPTFLAGGNGTWIGEAKLKVSLMIR
ncbi:hypothetical protein MTY_2694 [Moorella thermoacetica Y72]|uniref:Uncharacterized protein n=1 Tax=Moorella thermoacetica Y72 TaxID=1325331 RepID=A0A0S6UIH6_NEOTH|nr:hypothetical protein MTY_2694 [Moorella thermoacetica Y72]